MVSLSQVHKEINGGKIFLSRMSLAAKRECEAYTRWMGPAPMLMIG